MENETSTDGQDQFVIQSLGLELVNAKVQIARLQHVIQELTKPEQGENGEG